MLFNDAVSVGGRIVIARGFAFGEAGNAEIVVRTFYTLYADLWREQSSAAVRCEMPRVWKSISCKSKVSYRRCDVDRADIADIFDTTLRSPDSGLLLDEPHTSGAVMVGRIDADRR